MPEREDQTWSETLARRPLASNLNPRRFLVVSSAIPIA